MSDATKIARILEQRAARRRRLSALSFEEKIEIIERLRVLRFNRKIKEDGESEPFDAQAKPEEIRQK